MYYTSRFSRRGSLITLLAALGANSGSAASEVGTSTNIGWSPYSLESTLTAQSGDRTFGLGVAAMGDDIGVFTREYSADGDPARLELFTRSSPSFWTLVGSAPTTDGDSPATDYLHYCYSVAISGSNLILGQPLASYFVDGEGSANIYRKSEQGWDISAVVTPPHGTKDEEFGCKVAVSGDTVAISAPFAGNGLVYVADYDGAVWSITQTLSVSDPEASCVGCGLAISGDTIVVGAPGYTKHGVTDIKHQAAFVFRRSAGSWRESGAIRAPDQEIDDDFAESVAVSGKTIAIGAPMKNGVGAFYVFEESGDSWSIRSEFIETAPVAQSALGLTLAIDGDRLLVSERGRQQAILFERQEDNWRPRNSFFVDSMVPIDNFGFALAVSGRTVVIGSPNDSSGQVYIFRDDQLFSSDFDNP